ncbi:MAG: hypothetical protein J6Q89_06665, partial [Clostridia bacterium]|nr:hypothetical protein [Clostridia bacterium]
GVADLDGNKVYGETTVATNGKHTLTVTSGNGGVSRTYEFEINFTYGNFIKNDLACASAAVDEENGYICLYSESLVGVRIYDINSPEKYLHFLPVGRVYDHVFTENNLLLFGDNGITVLNRENALDGENAIDKTVNKEEINLYFSAENTIFGFGDNTIYSLDLETEETNPLTDLEFEMIKAFYENGNLYLLSIDALYSYNIENETIDKLFDINTANKKIAFGDGYIAVGNRLIDITNGEVILEFAANNGVKIANGLLFTERSIINIESRRMIGSFEFPIFDMVSTNRGVYLFGLDNDFALISNSAEGVAIYGAAQSFDKGFSDTESVNVYRSVLFYDRYTQPISLSSGELNLFALFKDKHELYSLSLDNLSENETVSLAFSPKSVYASSGYVIVSFANMPYVYLAQETDSANGVYIPLGSICDSAFVLDGRLYCTTENRLVYCPINETNITETDILAEKAVCDGENIYALNGNTLYVYNSNLVNNVTIATQRGDLLLGNGIAVGDTVYLDFDEEPIQLDASIIAFKGNTVITKHGVYDLKTNEYIGKTGVNSIENAIICEDNSLCTFDSGLISVCSSGDGSDVTEDADISGISEGGIYLDSVTIEYAHGIGYLDGEPFESGDTASGAGTHIFKVALPCGRNISVSFTIEANIERIEFLVGDRVMSVGETVTLRVRYLPDGAGSVPVKYSCDSDGLQIGEMGEITALEVGEYEITATVTTEYGTFETACTITVRDDLIVFKEDSGITIDRDNGFILGVKAGTTSKDLISQLISSGDAFVLNEKGNNVTDHVGTNNKLVLYRDGEKTDSLTIVIAGDTDGDGFITAYDLYTLEQILRGESYDAAFLVAADANRNGITADNDYRDLKNNLLYIIEAELGTPNKNLFGLSTIQTVSRIESGSIIDAVVCISGCKYTRGISGVIDFGEGLEFIEGKSTGWQTDYRELDNKVSFYAFGNDGKECGSAFKLLINLRFRVTAEAGKTISFSSNGLTAANDSECSIIRFETTELFVYEQQKGDFKIDFLNASDFEFDENKREYDSVIPYNSALADISVTRKDGQTVSLSNPVIPDNGKNTVTVTLTEENGISKVYTIRVTRDKEPHFDTNCRLSILEIEGFRLTPQFSPDILSYNVTVPYGTEKINIYCAAQNPMASVIVGDTTIKGEETIISVTVGTPDGETLKYLINVF